MQGITELNCRDLHDRWSAILGLPAQFDSMMGEPHRLLKAPRATWGPSIPRLSFWERNVTARLVQTCAILIYITLPRFGQIETYLNCLPLFLSFLLSSVKLCLGLGCHCLGSTASADVPPVNITLPLTWLSYCRTRDSRDRAFGLESGRHCFSFWWSLTELIDACLRI